MEIPLHPRPCLKFTPLFTAPRTAYAIRSRTKTERVCHERCQENRPVKRATVVAHIRHLCCLGLVPRRLCRHCSNVCMNWLGRNPTRFWVDEQDEIANFWAEKILPAEVMRLYFREFYNRPAGGFQSTIKHTAGLIRGIDRTTRELVSTKASITTWSGASI